MRFFRSALPLFILAAAALLLFTPTRALGQYVVDCTGNTPGAYTTINSVIPLLTNGSVVRITGPCTENVTITGLANLNIGAPYGQSAALNGNLGLNSVQNLYLYGMNVGNGSGISINASSGVTLDHCTSSNSSSIGLNIGDSIVNVNGPADFSNNGSYGIEVGGASDLNLNGYPGPITVDNNTGIGIELQDGILQAFSGNLIVTNTKAASMQITAPGFENGYGIQLLGHARAVLYDWSPSTLPPNVISGNQGGGISLQEGSEVSVSGAMSSGSGPWQTNIIDSNGPVGVYVG
ncbi:MAG: right-handed parallel beta-helix repeat-containing protein [Terracidiphilus sp.]